MSWVFLTEDRVYKLKKPVRFAYLDFSTLDRRRAACVAELTLNRRLAPEVYLDLLPLTYGATGLAVGGDGLVVDWLVVMRRLDEEWMLEERVIAGSVAAPDIDRLVDRLSLFYRHAAPDRLSPGVHLVEWRRKLAENRSVLLRGELGLPVTEVMHVDRVQRRYVDERGEVFASRVRSHRIIDGHGDLRPEHVWLGTPVLVIDCLEFSARLRSVDPFDEISYLGIECARLGAPWIGGYAVERLGRSLHQHPPHHLLAFYRTYRATLRARLAIAHLLEPTPRSPEKWGPLARRYLQLALDNARTLDQVLSENRPLRLRSRGL